MPTNRLSRETSPYLLQHQHNPVDWYPWGEEAFAAAREQDKPIFLSVGYSTCYWCHVMERECFESPFVAAEMNARFINIKVDREERPDVDQLYMTAVQILTRHGGWPMSVFLKPDLRPFYGGTYFPPNDTQGRPGFPTLLAGLEDAYRNRRGAVDRSANQLVDALQQLAQPPSPTSPLQIDAAFVADLIARSAADYDPEQGGFGSAPKFPRETLLELLLSHQRQHPDPARLRMITHTLDAMMQGGIRDQLGGGFHRYSTDADWLVPHFEIMGYDNAMLGWCYAEAFAQTQDVRYAAVARGVFDFVLRELTGPDGAFYTALDAEVDSQEGLNYLWTEEEVRTALAASLGDAAGPLIDRFCNVYGLSAGANFADPHHGSGLPEKNILFLAEVGSEFASPLLDADLDRCRRVLYEARARRKQPLLDTKIITSWNGLMIRAMAFAGRVLGEPSYVTAAARAADFLLSRHATADGGLARTSRDGVAKTAGFLDDYAVLGQAMLELHDATGEPRWRDEAGRLADQIISRFGDAADGLFFNQAGAADLIVRQKVASDSPLPSGNAIAARVFLSLGRIDAARGVIAAFAQQAVDHGEGMSALVLAMDEAVRAAGAFTVSKTGPGPVSRPASPRQQAGQMVTLATRWANPQLLQLRATIAAGYHLNAHPAADGMIATQLAVTQGGVASAATVDYPAGQRRSFAFSADPLPIYSHDVVFAVRFAAPPQLPVQLALTYQACDDSACLPPTTVMIEATGA